MAAISQVIPNLLGGVSQQPDPLKLPGQVREAENVLLDPTFGCRKRPPTQFVGKLSSVVPDNAKWFPIFRDGNERYVVAIYKNTSNVTTVKVWEATTGVERTVTVDPTAADYLDIQDVRNFSELTINDYTLISNGDKIVTMSDNIPEAANSEALLVINQVAYNTTYTVDFLKDGQNLVQEKVWNASALDISPGSFEDATNNSCAAAGTQSFNESSGSKTGLGFTITTNCNPTLVTEEIPGIPYPTAAAPVIPSTGMREYFGANFGDANQYAVGSYLYQTLTTTNGNLTVRVEVRVNGALDGTPNFNRYDYVSAQITDYNATRTTPWAEGPAGTHTQGGVTLTYNVTSIKQDQSTNQYSYKSVYTSRVQLNNSGQNWRVGDYVDVVLAGKTYRVTVTKESFGFTYASEASVSHTTSLDTTSGTLDVGSITAGLVGSINGLTGYSATPIGNVIHITRSDGRDFNIQTRGGTTNNALYGIKSSVNDVSLLPSQCVPDVVLLIRNSMESDADDYYVKFKSSSGDIPGQGSWEETVKPGIPTDLNLSTMPVTLIREANGTFSVKPLSPQFSDSLFWAPREVGDEDSNPEPSFVGKTIKDLFFYMNRLGVLSSDSVILSQPGDYFNFFVGSAIAVSDADPIDMTASSTKPATLKAALGTPKGLLLFAENSQFLLSTSDAAFGPATVKMSELSSYSYSSDIRPLETGVSVLFSTEAETFSKVYEMSVDSIDNRPLVSENTRIVPEYIPPNLTFAASSSNNSLVVYGNDTNVLWVFKFFNTGNERSLAGWCKWILPSPVRLIAFDHDTGFLVCNNNGDSIILRLEMLDDPRTSPISAFGYKFTPRLDHSLYKSQVTIVATADASKKIIRFPDSSYVDLAQPCIILTLDGNSTLFRSPTIEQDSTGYYITVDSDIADTDFIVGLEYAMKVELPSFFVTEDKKADRRNPPMVENVYLDLYYSGRYSVTVDRTGYVPRTVDLDVTTADIYFANNAAIDELATKGVPVYCRGDFSRLTINALDPLPSSITSYRWEGHYNNRGISIV